MTAGRFDDPTGLYERYETIFEGIEAPFAFVDLDALRANADEMIARSGSKPIRVASKSVRCREVLSRIGAHSDRWQGHLCFTLPEALFLADRGFRDLVVGYPTMDRHAVSTLAGLAAADPAAAPTLMVDDPVQLDLIEGAVGRGTTPIKVAIDLDVAWQTLRGNVSVGPKRSPVRTPEQARKLAEEIVSRPGLELDGLMAYEGQVAGVGDAAPGQPLKNLGIRRDAEGVDGRAPRAPGGDSGRGRAGRAAALRQRRRHRQPPPDLGRARRHRARRRVRASTRRSSSTTTRPSR